MKIELIRELADMKEPNENHVRQMQAALADLLEDALNFRALKASKRITCMGWAGFGKRDADPEDETGYRHLTLNFWTTNTDTPQDQDDQAKMGREYFDAYVQQCRKNMK